MNLLVIWLSFIIFIGIFQKISLLHYFFLIILMLWFTYLYNLVKPLQISLKLFILFTTLPSIVMGYITFIYNNFLIVNTY